MTRKALPQNYFLANGDVLASFVTRTGWSIANATATADAVNYKTSPAATKITADIGSVVYIQHTLTQEINYGLSLIGVWIYWYSDPSITLDHMTTYITSSDFEINLFKNVGGGYFHQGWNLFLINKSDWSADGDSIQNKILKIRMDFYQKAGQQSIFTLSDFRINIQRAPRIVFTFDDALLDTYTKAFAYMNEKDIPGTIYVIKNTVGSVGAISMAQLIEMYNAGWAIGNHTTTHPILTTLDASGIATELLTCSQWLDSCGFTRGSYHVAYPGGEHNATVDTVMGNLEMLTGRVAGTAAVKLPLLSPNANYAIDCVMINVSTYTLSQAMALIDATITKGVSTILGFHGLPTSDPTHDQWLYSNFTALVDYIATKKVKCVTIDEWYEGLTNPRYRSLPLNRATV